MPRIARSSFTSALTGTIARGVTKVWSGGVSHAKAGGGIGHGLQLDPRIAAEDQSCSSVRSNQNVPERAIFHGAALGSPAENPSPSAAIAIAGTLNSGVSLAARGFRNRLIQPALNAKLRADQRLDDAALFAIGRPV